MEYMKIQMQSDVARHPSMSAAPQEDKALAARIDLITAAAALHDISVEKLKIMYKFTILLSNNNNKKLGQGGDEWLASLIVHGGQEALPEILTINKWL